MPRWEFSRCYDALVVPTGDDDNPFKGHFDDCTSTNYLRDGFWRWFFANSTCNCICHSLMVEPKRALQADSTKTRQAIMLLMGILGSGAILFFLANLLVAA